MVTETIPEEHYRASIVESEALNVQARFAVSPPEYNIATQIVQMPLVQTEPNTVKNRNSSMRPFNEDTENEDLSAIIQNVEHTLPATDEKIRDVVEEMA